MIKMPNRDEEFLPRAAFASAVSSSQLLGLGIMVMTGIWMGKYRGGFDWNGTEKQFNYHPLFMVIGMAFLNAEALMTYRIFRYETKVYVRVIHVCLQIATFIFAVAALLAVFSFKDHMDLRNITSLHSWVGLVLVIAFGLQLVFGFLVFVIPGVPESTQAFYLRFHKFFGVSFFALSIGNCLVGITNISRNFDELGAEALLANCLGLVLIVYCFSVLAVIIPKEFHRPTEKERAIMMLERYDSD